MRRLTNMFCLVGTLMMLAVSVAADPVTIPSPEGQGAKHLLFVKRKTYTSDHYYAQFYGMYWGRKNLTHKDHPNLRPVPTFKRATSYTSFIPEEER